MMTKAEHTRYIESARWKARAAQHLRRHPRCVCGRRDQLQVHHLSYDHAGEGKEPDRDLLTLCRRHHELAHEYERSGQYGQPYAGRTLRKATEAMVRDQIASGGRTPVRAWLQRLTGRRHG
jgi:hypothetical protein